jgi:hypothetical protein
VSERRVAFRTHGPSRTKPGALALLADFVHRDRRGPVIDGMLIHRLTRKEREIRGLRWLSWAALLAASAGLVLASLIPGGAFASGVVLVRDHGDRHAAPPDRPGEGGRLLGIDRTTMHGGAWLVPVGQAHASGRAVVRFYGHTEVCWRFSNISGVGRRADAMIWKGQVAPNSTGPASEAALLLGPASHLNGCETAIPPRELRPIERAPSSYFIAIGNRAYAAAIGGQL